jgi:ribonuclease HIII
LLIEGKKDSAVKVLDKANEFFPNSKIPFDMYVISHVQIYYAAGAMNKGTEMAEIIIDKYANELTYYDTLEPKYRRSVAQERAKAIYTVKSLLQIAQVYNQEKLIKKAEEVLKIHPEM